MYIWKTAKRNIRRTPYQAMAASMVMFLTFLTLLLFLLLAIGSQKILQHYESKPQAIAFFKDNTTQSDIQTIQDALKKTDKVTALKFISKEEALDIYRERNQNNPTLLELVTASILPASLEIYTVSPGDLGAIAEILKKEPVIEEVVVPEDVIQTLTRATSIIRWIGGASVVFLIAFSFLVILMIIGFKIRLKRTEIEIMRLLGASTWFVRMPFLIEGIFYGVAGASAAWIITYASLWYFSPWLIKNLQEVELLPISPLLMLELLGIALVVAVAIGFLGSFGALRRY